MTQFLQTARGFVRTRRLLVPALALGAVALTAQAALAGVDKQPKPELKVEAERTPRGARLSFDGKGWPAAGRIKISGTRAPGTNVPQEFGIVTADSSGVFTLRKTVGCTVDNNTQEKVTITAQDSVSGARVTKQVDGASWWCM